MKQYVFCPERIFYSLYMSCSWFIVHWCFINSAGVCGCLFVDYFGRKLKRMFQICNSHGKCWNVPNWSTKGLHFFLLFQALPFLCWYQQILNVLMMIYF